MDGPSFIALKPEAFVWFIFVGIQMGEQKLASIQSLKPQNTTIMNRTIYQGSYGT